MKNKLLILFVFFCFTVNSQLHAEKKVYFGIFNSKNTSDLEGVPFLGFFNKKFIKCGATHETIFSDAKSILGNFKLNSAYPAVDADGKAGFIKIAKISDPEGGEYDPLLNGNADSTLKTLPLLFWNAETLRLHVSSMERAEISEGEMNNLQKIALKMFAAKNNKFREPKYKLVKIYKPVVLKPVGTNIETVVFNLDIVHKENASIVDNRARVFFLYNGSAKKIILSRFGHPEWSPDAKEVETIIPVLFFELESKKFFLAKHDGPWESPGYGVFELETGRKCMQSY